MAQLDDFVLVHPQLVLAVDGAGGEEDVDPRLLGVAHGVPGAVDVGLAAAGQAADDRALDVAGDLADRLEVARRGDGKAGLDHVDAQFDERWATSIFSARFMLAPGDCSPSRSVVSKITIGREVDWTDSVMTLFLNKG